MVDIETTGGKPADHRMTEIAMCVVEDDTIVHRYSSLMNPEQPIPDFIQLMTGITQDMVRDAPAEEDVMPGVLEWLFAEDVPTVFVAHNVGFDWSFVAESCARSGVGVPDVPRLCSCRLSRRLSTGLAKHNLGAVAEHYGITITARHRAMGDAQATAEALILLIERARNEHDATTLGQLMELQHAPRTAPLTKSESKVKQLLAPRLAELPDEPGVYYFYNTKKVLLYVGKAKSLRDRVRQYFGGGALHGKSVRKMIRYIRRIEWETTGTELGAMLLESREIKQQRPVHNRAALEYHPPTFIAITNEDFPRVVVTNRVEGNAAEVFGPFRSARMAERIANMVVREHTLRRCDGELKPSAEARPCFDFHVKRCEGPCALHQTIDSYRSSVDQARKFLLNVESGAIAHLAEQMSAAADELDFERAAMLRDGIRAIERASLHAEDRPLSVSQTNMIIIVPTSDRYATVEVYALRGGRLAYQRVVGTGAPVASLVEDLQHVYAIEQHQAPFTDRELDELQIITSWLYKRREKASTIVVRDVNVLSREVETAMRMYKKRTNTEDAPGEYSQLPHYDESGH